MNIKNLNRPSSRVDVILDTDTFNEIDDQFAVAYMLKNADKLNVKAIYAAPFLNEKSTSPKDGMEKSYDEIHKILGLMGADVNVYKGSERFLSSETQPESSPAAEHLARLAMDYSPENPLYVVAIGAITNIASAVLINPKIVDNIVVVWLGGNALHWHDTKEFNLFQDVAAARVIFGCGAALIQLPCMGVVSAFTLSEADIRHWLSGKNKLCDYLAQSTIDEASSYAAGRPWTRAIWDVTAVAWLIDGRFLEERLEHSPIPEYDGHYAFDGRRHFIRYVYHIHRDALAEDLFNKLTS
ncbi:MAG: nucleoside hydrolase [Oscillospiraceae bacterium]|nr:nucleoside hydrolase [Oscillospiraceae bacterium]